MPNSPFQVPDPYEAQEEQIARQQAYANLLQQQEMQPLQGTNSGMFYVAPSWTQGLAKLFQGYASGKLQNIAQQRQKALAGQYQSDMANTLERANQAMQGAPAIPNPSDEVGGGPGRAAQPPDMSAAARILMGNPATQGLGVQQYQQLMNQNYLKGLLAPQGGSPATVPQGPTPQPANAGTPTGDMQTTMQRLMLSGNPQAQAYAKFLMEQSKLSGGVQYDQNGNAFTLDVMGNPHPLNGIQARPEGIVQNTGNTTGLVDKHTGLPIGPSVPMGVAPKVEMVNNGQSIQPTIVGQNGAQPVGAATPVQVSPNAQLSANTAIRGQNMTDVRQRELNGILSNGQQSTPDQPLGNPGWELTAQGIAKGQIAPLSGFAMKTPYGQAVMGRVLAINPNYSFQDVNASNKALGNFTSGQRSKVITSLNVVTQHIAALDQAAQALNNGNIQLFNQIGNTIAAQTGQAAPTTFAAMSKIVGDEVVKAVEGSGGGVADRAEAAKMFSGANSPAQWQGVRNGVIGLMGGQLKGQAQAYKSATGRDDFNTKFLSPETQGLIGGQTAPTTGVKFLGFE